MVAIAWTPLAQAHAVAPATALATFTPWLDAALALAALFYVAGTLRLWRKAGRGHGLAARHVAFFAAGWTALAVALASPLDALAESLFSVHMVQHEVLMVVAAPLLVLGRPLFAWTWALPRGRRHALGALARSPWLALAWTVSTAPLAAWGLHAAALWLWHVPRFFHAALLDPGIHVAQHACFFASALLFWWSVTRESARRPAGPAMASVFSTMLHTSLLGALLTFAPAAFYGFAAPAWGLTALEDQQLGGLVMWVPGGFAYLAAGLVIAARYLAGGRRLAASSE